jgi:serpin B
MACANESPSEAQPGQINFSVQETQVAGASNNFGLALLQKLRPGADDSNLLVSPLSVSMALGMAMNGARNETLAAMQQTLGFGNLSEADINAAYRGLLKQLENRDPKVEFTIANSVWHERTFNVHAPFLTAAQQHFNAHVAALDFLSPSAPGTINGWVSERTGGRIKDLIQSIDPMEKLFLVNAMYFKAPWTTPFEKALTRNGAFTRADGSTVPVPLMGRDGAFPNFQDESVQVVEMPYADSTFGMVLVAPREGGSLNTVIEGLTAERWSTWTGALQNGRIMLTVPKFQFRYGEILNSALEALGMGIAFVPGRADFMRIADRDDLYISRVIHKTFIDVHELGTEAAAATAVGISITSLPPEFRFDRPFLFAIRERSTGTILFLGVVGDPSKS